MHFAQLPSCMQKSIRTWGEKNISGYLSPDLELCLNLVVLPGTGIAERRAAILLKTTSGAEAGTQGYYNRSLDSLDLP